MFNANDINRIRLLLATVRLEQGNVGSAAEELGRSLGIALTVPPANSDTTAQRSANTAQPETSSPTTILQSLHPKIDEPSEYTTNKPKYIADSVPLQTSEKKESATATADADSPEKENAADATVSDLIREGLAGLKDHLFNPLSILGVARIAPDGEKDRQKQEERKTLQKNILESTERKIRNNQNCKG